MPPETLYALLIVMIISNWILSKRHIEELLNAEQMLYIMDTIL